ncbi:MAG: signal peptide peptidase SppA [Phycisphaeraceae bacterium]|nr:MAG: signal peptide peptidase SppA [Phycisphaeraceae bacterium]
MRMTGILAAATAVLTAGLVACAQTYDVRMLEIKGDPPVMDSPFSMFGEASPTLRDYVDLLHDAADDPDLEGLIVRVKDATLNVSEVEEIGQAMREVHDAGKTVYMFAEGYDTAEVLLASYADDAMLQQGGGVSFPGVYMEEMYLADTLGWLGLEANFVQIGDYKGADETITRSAPSKAWDENISGLLDAMYANMRGIVKDGRGLSDAELDQAMDEAWWADGDTAIDAGLIDAEVDLTGMLDHVESYAIASGWTGDGVSYKGELGPGEESVDFANPLLIFAQLFQPVKRQTTGPTIALLHINGTIIDGDSTPEGPFSSASVGSRTIRNAIKQIAKDDNIEGVIVRIDSPGGSAIASEVIWQGLHRLAQDKPVWVSVGSMAASGGYYIAVGGQTIYVDRASIVGSIGVVGGKIALAGLLDKGHVHVVGRARGPHADLFSSTEPWSEAEMAMIRSKMTETYDQFTGRVTAGRPGIDLSKTAEGRLFLGRDAVKLKMADKVGSLDDALNDMASSLSLKEYDVMDFPEPPSLEDMLSQAFGGMIKAPIGSESLGEKLAMLKGVLGEQRFNALRDAVTMGAMLKTEPVLLTSPQIVTFK